MSSIMSAMKEKVGQNPRVANFVGSFYYSIPVNLRRHLAVADHRTTLESYLKPLLTSTCFFVKIGAYDGLTGDPISNIAKRYDWSGLMVEPVKYIFDQLQNNYGDNGNFFLENAAISDKNEFRDFYYLRKSDDPRLPIWYNQIGSFYKEHLLKMKEHIPSLDELLVSEPIQCLTIETLLQKHKVQKVDFIHIDTEGFDFEIIKLIDFTLIQPFAILYEHLHLKDGQKEISVQYLAEKGYQSIEIGNDILSFKSSQHLI